MLASRLYACWLKMPPRDKPPGDVMPDASEGTSFYDLTKSDTTESTDNSSVSQSAYEMPSLNGRTEDATDDDARMRDDAADDAARRRDNDKLDEALSRAPSSRWEHVREKHADTFSAASRRRNARGFDAQTAASAYGQGPRSVASQRSAKAQTVIGFEKSSTRQAESSTYNVFSQRLYDQELELQKERDANARLVAELEEMKRAQAQTVPQEQPPAVIETRSDLLSIPSSSQPSVPDRMTGQTRRVEHLDREMRTDRLLRGYDQPALFLRRPHDVDAPKCEDMSDKQSVESFVSAVSIPPVSANEDMVHMTKRLATLDLNPGGRYAMPTRTAPPAPPSATPGPPAPSPTTPAAPVPVPPPAPPPVDDEESRERARLRDEVYMLRENASKPEPWWVTMSDEGKKAHVIVECRSFETIGKYRGFVEAKRNAAATLVAREGEMNDDPLRLDGPMKQVKGWGQRTVRRPAPRDLLGSIDEARPAVHRVQGFLIPPWRNRNNPGITARPCGHKMCVAAGTHLDHVSEVCKNTYEDRDKKVKWVRDRYDWVCQRCHHPDDASRRTQVSWNRLRCGHCTKLKDQGYSHVPWGCSVNRVYDDGVLAKTFCGCSLSSYIAGQLSNVGIPMLNGEVFYIPKEMGKICPHLHKNFYDANGEHRGCLKMHYEYEDLPDALPGQCPGYDATVVPPGNGRRPTTLREHMKYVDEFVLPLIVGLMMAIDLHKHEKSRTNEGLTQDAFYDAARQVLMSIALNGRHDASYQFPNAFQYDKETNANQRARYTKHGWDESWMSYGVFAECWDGEWSQPVFEDWLAASGKEVLKQRTTPTGRPIGRPVSMMPFTKQAPTPPAAEPVPEPMPQPVNAHTTYADPLLVIFDNAHDLAEQAEALAGAALADREQLRKKKEETDKMVADLNAKLAADTLELTRDAMANEQNAEALIVKVRDKIIACDTVMTHLKADTPMAEEVRSRRAVLVKQLNKLTTSLNAFKVRTPAPRPKPKANPAGRR